MDTSSIHPTEMLRAFFCLLSFLCFACNLSLAVNVTFTGYIVDWFCWASPNHTTPVALGSINLEKWPARHSVPCLSLDKCKASGYLLLEKSSNQLYQKKYSLDSIGNAKVLQLIAVTATEKGFRATVTGTVANDSTIQVSTLEEYCGANTPCSNKSSAKNPSGQSKELPPPPAGETEVVLVPDKLSMKWKNLDGGGVEVVLTLATAEIFWLAFGLVDPNNNNNKMVDQTHPSYVAFATDTVEALKLTRMKWKPGVPLSSGVTLSSSSISRAGGLTTLTLKGSTLGPLPFQPSDSETVTYLWAWGPYSKSVMTKRGFGALNIHTLKNNEGDDTVLLYRTLHGAFMTTIWAGSTLLGGIIARYYRHRQDWIKYHMMLQGVATILTMPLTIMSTVTKTSASYGTVHGQGGLIFGLLATFQGTVGTLVHGAHQHRLGFIGKPILMWKFRKFHRALGKALLVYATAQIALGIDALSGDGSTLNSGVGIAFITYSIMAWAGVLVYEYQFQRGGGHAGKRRRRGSIRGQHKVEKEPTYMGKADLRNGNIVYCKLVGIGDVALRYLNLDSRETLYKYVEKHGSYLDAIEMKYNCLKYSRGHRSLRNEVLVKFIVFLAEEMAEELGALPLSECIKDWLAQIDHVSQEEIKNHEIWAAENWIGYFVPSMKTVSARVAFDESCEVHANTEKYKMAMEKKLKGTDLEDVMVTFTTGQTRPSVLSSAEQVMAEALSDRCAKQSKQKLGRATLAFEQEIMI